MAQYADHWCEIVDQRLHTAVTRRTLLCRGNRMLTHATAADPRNRAMASCQAPQLSIRGHTRHPHKNPSPSPRDESSPNGGCPRVCLVHRTRRPASRMGRTPKGLQGGLLRPGQRLEGRHRITPSAFPLSPLFRGTQDHFPEDQILKSRCVLPRTMQHFLSFRCILESQGICNPVDPSACLLYTSPSPRD